jgi:glycosyltransferase involved in cell wall biosynthesis
MLIVTSFCDRPERELFCRMAGHLDVFMICDPSNPGQAALAEAGVRITAYPVDKVSHAELAEKIRTTVSANNIESVYAPRTEILAAAIQSLMSLAVRLIGYRGTTGHMSIVDIGPRLTYKDPRIDAIVCVSEAVRQYLIGKGIRPDKLVTIPKGHDPSWYSPAPRSALTGLGIPEDSFAIGFAGRARRIKGVAHLVRAVTLMPPELKPHLLIAGDIDDLVVKAQLRLPSVSRRVHCAGFRSDAAGLMGACNAFVMPSIKREGLPRALIEAMAQGVPPVATSVGGIPELIQDGVSGILVPPRDAKAIAGALSSLALDPARAAEIGRNARKRIAGSFNIAATAAKMLSIFQQ